MYQNHKGRRWETKITKKEKIMFTLFTDTDTDITMVEAKNMDIN